MSGGSLATTLRRPVHTPPAAVTVGTASGRSPALPPRRAEGEGPVGPVREPGGLSYVGPVREPGASLTSALPVRAPDSASHGLELFGPEPIRRQAHAATRRRRSRHISRGLADDGGRLSATTWRCTSSMPGPGPPYPSVAAPTTTGRRAHWPSPGRASPDRLAGQGPSAGPEDRLDRYRCPARRTVWTGTRIHAWHEQG